ncbi:Shedu anti-phage system protein SduA domain-containing protein [Rathayibacter sp. SD072]|uniref:Shedu anti-phage system protein SduA domain-containing protein n=1 Tax=Rathayibacter sp. SD072 TaxID=2781731 RepID=UPI001A96B22F|nr:Shedu anti-phage system protein SduA domain-containing protein [Rathayibacter sp. SD072]MBO0984997.1 DUF4263 domain-containing protein [Rathayibacter sp. SD072]
MLEQYTHLEPDANPDRPRPMDWQTYSDTVMQEWYALLLSEPEESAVQTFLELHPAMIPGGSGDVGPGGHHGSDLGAVFTRPRLNGAGLSFEPDFMWVTRSSSTITPILIEIEKPSKRWFKMDGRPTAAFTEAHDQLNDWRTWFARDGNERIFREQYQLLGDHPNRPVEPQYVLIYGRSSEFDFGGGHTNPDDLNHKRNGMRKADETFFTFDSLKPKFEHSDSITLRSRAKSLEPVAFSPVFTTGPWMSDGSRLLGDPTAALVRTQHLTQDRRDYLAKRIAHWQKIDRERESGRIRVGIRSGGRE